MATLIGGVMERKKDVQSMRAIIGCRQNDDEFVSKCPFINRKVIDGAFVDQYLKLYDDMWTVTGIDDEVAAESKDDGEDDDGGSPMVVKDQLTIALGQQLTVDMLKLIAHASSQCLVEKRKEFQVRITVC